MLLEPCTEEAAETMGGWARLGASGPVTMIMTKGYSIRFSTIPRLSSTPVWFPLTRNIEKAWALDLEVEALLQKAITGLSKDPGPGYYSLVFLVKKRNRLVQVEQVYIGKYLSNGDN